MRKIGVRAVSGVVFVAIMLSAIYFGIAVFSAWMLFVLCVAMWEFYHIARHLPVRPNSILGFVMGLIIYGAACVRSFFVNNQDAVNLSTLCFYLLIPFAVAVFIAELYRRREQPFINIAYTLLGVIYIALPLSLMPITFAEVGRNFIFCYFILLWSNDTFAYLVGICIGKHQLFPRHSPKKSWEGYVGGICSVALSSYILHQIFLDVPLLHIAVTGLIISLTSTLGDLVESMLKRNAGIKDAGKIMPGHGGFLDRFDVSLISFPLVYLFMKFVQILG
jgi:phosphatidate cytidylyltransferase